VRGVAPGQALAGAVIFASGAKRACGASGQCRGSVARVDVLHNRRAPRSACRSTPRHCRANDAAQSSGFALRGGRWIWGGFGVGLVARAWGTIFMGRWVSVSRVFGFHAWLLGGFSWCLFGRHAWSRYRCAGLSYIFLILLTPVRGGSHFLCHRRKESNQRKRPGRRRYQDVIWLATRSGPILSVALKSSLVLARPWMCSYAAPLAGTAHSSISALRARRKATRVICMVDEAGIDSLPQITIGVDPSLKAVLRGLSRPRSSASMTHPSWPWVPDTRQRGSFAR
jgi:hypothetical protein